jgi:hypothetical protein
MLQIVKDYLEDTSTSDSSYIDGLDVGKTHNKKGNKIHYKYGRSSNIKVVLDDGLQYSISVSMFVKEPPMTKADLAEENRKLREKLEALEGSNG